MADNVTLNAGSGGDVVATEDIAGVEYQKVKLVDGTAASTTAIPLSGDLTNGLDVDVTRVGGTVTVDNGGTFAVQATQSGGWTVTANAGTGTFAVSNAGLTELAAAINASSQMDVNLAAQAADITIADGGNSITVDGTVTANAGTGTFTVDLGANNDVVCAGDVANDSADSGNPIKVGGKAENDIDTVTLVAADDRVDFRAGRDGIQLVHPDGPLENFVNGNANATGTANTSVIAAQGAGIKTYLTDIIVTNASATDSEVIIKDGTTEKLRIAAPANGGAVSVGLRAPIAGTANTAWQFASADAVTTMYVYLGGFTSQI